MEAEKKIFNFMKSFNTDESLLVVSNDILYQWFKSFNQFFRGVSFRKKLEE